MRKVTSIVFLLFFYMSVNPVFAQSVVSVAPVQNALNVSKSTNISVTFDQDMNASNINDSTFIVHSLQKGLHTGDYSYSSGTYTATFNPDSNFSVGDIVSVILTKGIENTSGDTLTNPFAWSFTVEVDRGSGEFAPKVDYGAGNGSISVFSSDLDGDGDMDLAVVNRYSDSVSVLLNNGNGTFAAKVDYGVGNGPHSVFSSDLDGDGDMDLAAANVYSDSVSVLLNNGDGTFAAKVGYAAGEDPHSVFSSDLDGDGDMDLAAANVYSDSVSVFLNNGDGTFAAKVDYGVGDGPISVFSSDLDGDGDMDLATANVYSDSVSVLLNNGNGTFAAKVDYSVGNVPYSVFSSDLDGDGDMDLAVADYFSDSVSVLLNNGNGTFAVKVDYGVGDAPYSVFSSDLDGDGDMDLAVANADSDNVSVFLNVGPVINVTSPNGGEEWRADSTCFITWTSMGTSGTVRIEYSVDNGSAWTEIIASMPDTGVFSWVIPDTPSDSCLVSITDGLASDTSDAEFSIVPVSGIPDNKLPNVYSMSLKAVTIGNKLEVRYALPFRSSVTFSLYDIKGANIEKIVEEKPAGYHSMEIDMNNSPKGVYFLRIEANGFVKISKAVLI